jgi:hypothetical protein
MGCKFQACTAIMRWEQTCEIQRSRGDTRVYAGDGLEAAQRLRQHSALNRHVGVRGKTEPARIMHTCTTQRLRSEGKSRIARHASPATDSLAQFAAPPFPLPKLKHSSGAIICIELLPLPSTKSLAKASALNMPCTCIPHSV